MDEDRVTSEIRAYLAQHPQAMDTLEGIAEWWLMREHIRVNLTTLARVLHRLTELGVLEELGPPEGLRYRLKQM